jgi:putative transposase
MLADRRYCYPLTVSDFASRYLISCDALSTTKGTYAFTVFKRAFKDFGLPEAIRTDNGVPFASPHALFGLSRLSVWWLRLGIRIERIKPGHPEQNGRHERMHLTPRKKPPSRLPPTSFSSRPDSMRSSGMNRYPCVRNGP